MTRDTTGLGVVDLDCSHGPDLRFLDIEKVDVVSADVDDGEEEQRIGSLSVEPLRLI